jgi:hypothetical protein
MRYTPALCLAAALCLAVTIPRAQTTAQATAQTTDSLAGKLTGFPTRVFGKINSKTTDLQQQLTRQTEHYLNRMARQEEKLRAQLYKTDSVKAAALYPQDPKQQYAAMLQKFKQDSSRVFTSMGPEYLARVDSLQGALGFLNKNPGVLNASPALQAKMQASLASVQQLQAKLQATDAIQQFIASRKAQIQQALSGYTHLPSGITNAVAGYNSRAYYYADQVREYRSELNDPDKMMQTALVLLNKLPAFTGFMQKNSFLAGLFGVPAGYGTEQGMVGMQTRDQVMNMIKSQIGQGGGSGGASSGASAIQSGLQSAQQDITKIQNKLSALGAGSGGMDMPGFKPNDQKKKTFLKRLEVGVDLQTSQTTNYYPTTSNFGVSLGYQLGHGNVAGIGMAYKLGLGNGFQHMALSSQGIGLRSFLQVKVKKTWGLAGGFEYNFQQPFSSYQDIRNLSSWTRSGLIGITKTVSMKSTVFKKTQVQLLWDLLSYSNVPKTSPVLFRVGYAF